MLFISHNLLSFFNRISCSFRESVLFFLLRFSFCFIIIFCLNNDKLEINFPYISINGVYSICLYPGNWLIRTHRAPTQSQIKILLRMWPICHIMLGEMMTWKKMVKEISNIHTKIVTYNISHLATHKTNHNISFHNFRSKKRNSDLFTKIEIEPLLLKNCILCLIWILRIRLCHRSCISLKMNPKQLTKRIKYHDLNGTVTKEKAFSVLLYDERVTA